MCWLYRAAAGVEVSRAAASTVVAPEFRHLPRMHSPHQTDSNLLIDVMGLDYSVHTDLEA